MKTLANKNLLIFTGGGVAPALNSTLYGIIKKARQEGMNILGGMYGWASLMPNGKIINLNNFDIELIKSRGGTFLRSSRTNPFKEVGGIEKIKAKIKEFKIDYIIAIGGDDTLGAAYKAFKEYNLPIIGIPKTIDNDLNSTYWTPGFPTAAWQIVNYTKAIAQAAYAEERVFIMEVMGGAAGWVPASSIYGKADVIIPPEKEVSIKQIANVIEQRYKKNNNFAVITLSHQLNLKENFKPILKEKRDQYGIQRPHFISIHIKKYLEENIPGIKSVKIVAPGNFISASDPTNIDRVTSILLGQKAVNLLKEGKFGQMVSLKRENDNIIVSSTALENAVGDDNYRNLNDELFDFENFTVKEKFLDYMEPILGRYEKNNGYFNFYQ